jgi:hypothetical protein
MADIDAQSNRSPMYTRGNSDPVAKPIRAFRWLLWAAAIVSVILVVLHGTSLRQNRFALLEWICFTISITGNFVLMNVESSRRKKRQSERP